VPKHPDILPPDSSGVAPTGTAATTLYAAWQRATPIQKGFVFLLSGGFVCSVLMFALGQFFQIRGVQHVLTSRIFLGIAWICASVLFLGITRASGLLRWKMTSIAGSSLLLLGCFALDRAFPMPKAAAVVSTDGGTQKNTSPATTQPSATQPSTPATASTKKLQVLGIAPVDVYTSRRFSVDGKPFDSVQHGISFVVRVINGSTYATVSGMSLEGKVHLNGLEFEDLRFASPELKDLAWSPTDELQYFAKTKPYREVAWRAWTVEKPNVQLREGEERIIQFTLVEPGKTQEGFTTEGPGKLTDYVGYDEGAKIPKYVDRNPTPRSFFRDAYLLADKYPAHVKDDFSNGNVRFSLQVNSTSVSISPLVLLPVRRARDDDWGGASSREIYYGQNFFFRYNDLTPYHPKKERRKAQTGKSGAGPPLP
jgi:hypothetical protein